MGTNELLCDLLEVWMLDVAKETVVQFQLYEMQNISAVLSIVIESLSYLTSDL